MAKRDGGRCTTSEPTAHADRPIGSSSTTSTTRRPRATDDRERRAAMQSPQRVRILQFYGPKGRAVARRGQVAQGPKSRTRPHEAERRQACGSERRKGLVVPERRKGPGRARRLETRRRNINLVGAMNVPRRCPRSTTRNRRPERLSSETEHGSGARLLPLVGLQDSLAHPESPRRHLEQLVIGEELERLLE